MAKSQIPKIQKKQLESSRRDFFISGGEDEGEFETIKFATQGSASVRHGRCIGGFSKASLVCRVGKLVQ
ncbi:hypothetical protein AAC387_Pa05g3234 [Persea americana]